ncbi:MAG TPA: hydroxysqualene dehydroxylase HpnE [Candidatus Sulfotelmatobacter sp.]|nr:hydroxysqualene dehydroxylase HpnE [Candidatus Sulfotelmatobacter sp.]
MQSVLVIGGGLAGLSSAVVLAEAGLRVRLLEKRPHLGGRATSYTLPDGTEVDNCQHLALGCCNNLADFYRRVGAADKMRTYDRMFLVDAEGCASTIEAGGLPPPLHMAESLLSNRSLSVADKRGIANAMMAIACSGGRPLGIAGLSMLQWLRGMKQTRAAIERFWGAVLVSALDETLDRTDAHFGIDVFWKAFLANRGGYRVSIPSVPLAQLYDGCLKAVEKQGGEVRLRSGVREIRVGENGFAEAVLEDGSQVTADACIAALTHDVLPGVAPKRMSEPGEVLAGLRRMRNSPITSVHLWFDRPVMRGPFLALLDRTTQWIFNKTALYGPISTNGNAPRPTTVGADAEGSGGQYLQLVISASYELVPRSRQEIIELCCRELGDALPATREARLLKATVIKELNATFSPEPGVDAWRPPQDSGVRSLFFAGDFTRTGWPATMEGAVRSGYLAAEALLASFGRPQKILLPELPFEGLSKFWADRAASDGQ